MENLGLKPLGVFGTSSFRDPDVLRSLADQLPLPSIEVVCRYLREGVSLGPFWMCEFRDILSDDEGEGAPESWVTDGVYFWESDAGYYIRRYAVYLPPHIVLHCLHGKGRTAWARDHALEFERLNLQHEFPMLVSYSDLPEDPDAEEFPTVAHTDPAKVKVIGDVSSVNPADERLLTLLTLEPLEKDLREAVVWYLKSCQEVVYRGSIDDPARRRRDTHTRLAVYTDGKYLWRSDYAHSVQFHGAQVPDDLIERASKFEWTQLTPAALETVRGLLSSGDLREPSRRWLPA